MDKLFTVRYPAGKLALNLDSFFPCTVQKGKLLFRLIRDNCSDDEIRKLITYLQNRSDDTTIGAIKKVERCQKNAVLLAKITGIKTDKVEKRAIS